MILYLICLVVGLVFTIISAFAGHLFGGHDGMDVGTGGHAEAGFDDSGVPGVSCHEQRLGECATFSPRGILNGRAGFLRVQRHVQKNSKLQRIACRFAGRAIGFHHHAHSREWRWRNCLCPGWQPLHRAGANGERQTGALRQARPDFTNIWNAVLRRDNSLNNHRNHSRRKALRLCRFNPCSPRSPTR